MMRIFSTRVANSVPRTVLLLSCLLICLACATPFPIENLEEGMTAEAVREEFGEPEATETKPGGVDSSWSYMHEEKGWEEWFLTFLPLTYPVILPLNVAVGDPWDNHYVLRAPVVLHFEEEKLARWEVIEPVYGYATSGWSGTNPCFGVNQVGCVDNSFQQMLQKQARDKEIRDNWMRYKWMKHRRQHK